MLPKWIGNGLSRLGIRKADPGSQQVSNARAHSRVHDEAKRNGLDEPSSGDLSQSHGEDSVDRRLDASQLLRRIVRNDEECRHKISGTPDSLRWHTTHTTHNTHVYALGSSSPCRDEVKALRRVRRKQAREANTQAKAAELLRQLSSKQKTRFEPFRLLDLPFEVRAKILAHYSDHVRIRMVRERMPPAEPRPSARYRTRFSFEEDGPSSEEMLAKYFVGIGILRSNRQLRVEFLDTVFREQPVSFGGKLGYRALVALKQNPDWILYRERLELFCDVNKMKKHHLQWVAWELRDYRTSFPRLREVRFTLGSTSPRTHPGRHPVQLEYKPGDEGARAAREWIEAVARKRFIKRLEYWYATSSRLGSFLTTKIEVESRFPDPGRDWVIIFRQDFQVVCKTTRQKHIAHCLIVAREHDLWSTGQVELTPDPDMRALEACETHRRWLCPVEPIQSLLESESDSSVG